MHDVLNHQPLNNSPTNCGFTQTFHERSIKIYALSQNAVGEDSANHVSSLMRLFPFSFYFLLRINFIHSYRFHQIRKLDNLERQLFDIGYTSHLELHHWQAGNMNTLEASATAANRKRKRSSLPSVSTSGSL